MMIRNKLTTLLLILCVCVSAVAHKPMITAFYYPGPRRLTKVDLALNDAAIKHLDVLIYSASLQSLRPKGSTYYLPSTTAYNLQLLSNWIHQKKYPTKLMLSLGYWAPQHMRNTIISPSARKPFIQSIIKTLHNPSYGLSGIDIDWENVYSPVKNEISHFPLFVRDLEFAMQKAKLGSDLLTIDIPSNFISKFPAPKRWIHYVNWANLMGYEFYGDTLTYTELDGAFGNVTTPYGGKVPRYPTIALVTTLEKYHALGIPNSKMIVTLPTYGIMNHVKNTDAAHHFGLRQKIIGRHDVVVYPYWQIYLRYGIYGNTHDGYTAHQYTFKTPARAKGLHAFWLTKGTRFISYPDPIAIREMTRYISHHQYRGISIWDLADTVKFKDPNSLISTINKNK